MLTVYKASAGSGKTFQLVVEYLTLLAQNPGNYRHILAVTFTNKATNEMKSRILEQLYKLASDQKSDYLQTLAGTTGYSESQIRAKAGEALKNILHDYNRFSISTIDAFTQKVIKSFNRELGISPHFTLELDSDIILEEATERLLARLGQDRELLNWLREFSREKIENSASQRVEKDIRELGKEIFKERFQEFFPDDKESEYRRENLNDFGAELRQIKKTFEKSLKEKASVFVASMTEAGFSPADFSGGATRSIGTWVQKISEGNIPAEISKTAQNCVEDTEKWVAKTNKKRNEILPVVEQKLHGLLQSLVEFFGDNIILYNTALVVLKQLRTLGILSDLRKEIEALLKEKGILQLSDSNLLLNKIIGDSDSPFVYEKIGNHFKHFMLDEFQDTSGLQWKNFRPLVLNSLAEGNSNLVVGDVKQSIYRWRNSDWNILAEELDRDFTPLQKKEKHLEFNWRSDKNIIDFNNAIIGALKNTYEEKLFSSIPDNAFYLKKFGKIYESFEQKQGKKDAVASGYVEVNFLPDEDFRENATERLINQVKILQDQGMKASEIAILVRKNREGNDIVDAFLDASKRPENKGYNLTVLSNDSLFLYASKGVLFILHLIEWLIDPKNEITQATLLHLWMSWLKPALQKQGIAVSANKNELQLPFVDTENRHLDRNFKILFENELGHKLEQARKKVLLSSLDETVMHIASVFGLLHISSELPFIQTLADKSGELKSSLSNDLSNFHFWWKEKGYKTSVSVNENLDSIRLLTVHSSKGLEFRAVLLPYFDWETSRESGILWCQPQNAPFNRFPLLPIPLGKAMEASEFAGDYHQEKISAYIDSLNLIYVAFTRARSVLMINSCLPKENTQSKTYGADKLLLLALRKLAEKQPYESCFKEEESTFVFGTLPSGSEVSKPAIDTTPLERYHFNDFSERLQLRVSGDDFLVSAKNQQSEKNIGKLVHEILSEIETTADVETACMKAFREGRIDETELVAIRENIDRNLELPAVQNWFDGSTTVLTERELLTREQLLRPDRMMISGTNAIVVDYKTGERNPAKYNKQVQLYAETLKKTGFEKVKGFVWYLGEFELEQVCEV